MEPVLVFGHKNPDTDSICSTIATAYLKNACGTEAVPYRLGKINKETAFVLQKFGIKEPELLKTVSAQISDLTHVKKEVINVNDSIQEALDLMTKENFSSFPVVDEMGHLKNMIHISDIANTYLKIDYSDLFSKYSTTYENLIEVLNGKIISGVYPSGEINTNLKAISELDTIEKGDVVITTSMADGIDRLIKAGAKVIIVCCKEDDFISPRMTSECAVMVVNHSLFKTISLISQSISVGAILQNRNFYSFKKDDFLHEIKDIMKDSNQTNFPVIDNDGKVYGTIRTKNLINFTRKKVILVDHNEFSQSVAGLGDAQILQVIDHHKFANFQTNDPVKITAEAVGCSSTIVYSLFKEAGVVPPKEIAGIMLSAIISDTLLFRSPTCTEKDEKTAEELGKLAGIEDIYKYGMEMLIAGTSFDNNTPPEILNLDKKEFNMGGTSMAVAQVNTVDVEGLLKMKSDFEAAMNAEIKANGYDLFLFVITDIINSNSTLLAFGEKTNLVELAFNKSLTGNEMLLKGVVSRKKQILPFLMAATQSL
ncbi:putative manganese-dependent inorganic diphosphatase [Fusobacterium perfoetens]|uniref:putative manganese-dependent inorganic diphosphatase n=1 Tax=Fusobacterium perfoetens TaxID=852 RepID=UPI001F2D7AEA|nr:putative manganese-dependent inorganic diphosphatase [Fusobacterium perfoetens]MCF2624798.1 putative manganese-dependent inorganic diphosphatase [Fusobacterium perfoetens]